MIVDYLLLIRNIKILLLLILLMEGEAIMISEIRTRMGPEQ